MREIDISEMGVAGAAILGEELRKAKDRIAQLQADLSQLKALEAQFLEADQTLTAMSLSNIELGMRNIKLKEELAKQPKWVLLTDDQSTWPELSLWLQVYCQANKSTHVVRSTSSKRNICEFLYSEDSCDYYISGVTHWRPLPSDKPEEEKESR